MKKIRIYINGWFVGETELKETVNSLGEKVQLPDPRAAYGSQEASVIIEDPDSDRYWTVSGRIHALHGTSICRHQQRTPKGLCTDCGSTT